MLFLIGSIVFSSFLTIALKLCQKYNVSIFQAIVFNYITCIITGSVVNGSFPVTFQSCSENWFRFAVVMGVFFISLFYLMGVTAQKSGIAVASVCYKLSMVIPVIAAVYLYGDVLNNLKISGIVIALVAIIFTCHQPGSIQNKKPNYLLPVLLFIGSGILDAIINHAQKNYITASNNNAYLIAGFLSAAIIGICILCVQYIIGKQIFLIKNVLAGVIIGVPNYFSIWCLVNFLKQTTLQSSAGIPVNNMGIVLLSAIVAGIFFKEKLYLINWIGIVLSLTAISLIAFG